MSDDWTQVGTLTDAAGKRVSIDYSGGYVRFAIRSDAGIVLASIVLDGYDREMFQRAFMAAERAAETYDPAHPF